MYFLRLFYIGSFSPCMYYQDELGSTTNLPCCKVSLLTVGCSKEKYSVYLQGIPKWLSGKETTCNAGGWGFDPWVGKNSWRREWQLTPVYFSDKSLWQRNVVGYRPWDCKRVGHRLVTKQQQQARRMGSSCSKDPNSLTAFSEGFLEATLDVRVAACRLSSDWLMIL